MGSFHLNLPKRLGLYRLQLLHLALWGFFRSALWRSNWHAISHVYCCIQLYTFFFFFAYLSQCGVFMWVHVCLDACVENRG